MKSVSRMIWWLLVIGISVLLVGCAFYFGQDKIVFHPSRYAEGSPVAKGMVRLPYTTKKGRQVAFYFSSASATGAPPERLWLMFCGNASRALDLGFLANPPTGGRESEQRIGFLFVDYPGYGECQGRPGRESIHDNVAGSVDALAEHFSVAPELLWERAACFGHSLGAGVALESAAAHNVEDVVAVSPFRSIEAMAARTTGAPVSGWIRHNFDNEVALEKVASFPGAKVYLFHGDADRAIPVEMGRDLAAAHTEVVEYRELEGVGHNDILGVIEDDLREIFYR